MRMKMRTNCIWNDNTAHICTFIQHISNKHIHNIDTAKYECHIGYLSFKNGMSTSLNTLRMGPTLWQWGLCYNSGAYTLRVGPTLWQWGLHYNSGAYTNDNSFLRPFCLTYSGHFMFVHDFLTLDVLLS